MTSARRRLLINRDALNNAPRDKVARGCVRVFDRLQSDRKEHQLLALACAFALACRACDVPPQEVYQAASNLMASKMTSTGMLPQFNAMSYYLATEVLADD